MVFGIIMITSIGVPKSIQLSAPDVAYPNCSDPAVDCYLMLKNHLVRVILSIGAFLACLKINYRFWDKTAPVLYFISMGLLITVLIFGADNNTFAKSWINIQYIPFLNSIQPAEVAKFGLVVYLAGWFTKKMETRDGLDDWKDGFFAFAVIAGIVVLPVILQPDLGSTLVLVSIATCMYFLAGAPIKHFAVGGLITLIFALGAIGSQDYLQNRFKAFMFPGENCSEDYCWQSEQAKIAIGSGGLWGKGLTQGIQKSYWLPQASDDFIFAASAEELGFLRIIFVIIGYAVIAYKGFQIANHAPNRFSMMLATGITVWVSSQAFINILVNISLFPITGITLPFISYGGSSLLTTMAGMGVLLNISKYTTNHAYTSNRRRDSRSRYAQPRYRR
ncbi:putative lipid II flippase FtsW [Patescibacteria group bacterium]|nr:putative lipid II flippase FtsW [Patescibacteria group bacterium]